MKTDRLLQAATNVLAGAIGLFFGLALTDSLWARQAQANTGIAPDWVSAGANVVTAAAAAAAAFQGIRSLSAWRQETIGRRRMELAEDVLADFYEARDVLRWVRSPMAYGHESEGRPGRDEEDADIQRHRDTFYVPLKRLNDHAEFFAKMRARRYRVIAAFGPQAAEPYEIIHQGRNRIVVSAQALMRLNPRIARDMDMARQDRLEADIWDGAADENRLGNQIEQALQVAEERFRREISERA